MTKEEFIDLLISEYPQVREAFNFEEEVSDKVYAEEIVGYNMDDLYKSERAARVLEEWVYNAASRFLKDLNREIDAYERYAIR